MSDRTPVIALAIRTPIGKRQGALAGLRPDDMVAFLLREAVQRSGLDPADLDEVVLGCANQAGEDSRNVARVAALLAGFPDTTPGVTVNRLCASGMDAVVYAARMIEVGDADAVLAGGVESMSRAPWAVPKPEIAYAPGKRVMFDTAVGWRFENPRLRERFSIEGPGLRAENLAAIWKIPREAQDRYALDSHRKAVEAQLAGRFDDELVAVDVPQPGGGSRRVERDEQPRPDTSLEKLAALPPAFKEGGTVTAGNASPTNDGAAVLLVTSLRKARALGLRPLAAVGRSAVAGVDPTIMPAGPIPATRKLLERTGLSMRDVELVEFNEAFAVQLLVCCKELSIPAGVVNVHGGAIALGHPLGCSGARILVTLVHAMQQRGVRRALATVGVGVGQGQSMILEAVDG